MSVILWVMEEIRDRFNRLYELSLLKGETMAAMRALGWGDQGETWRWRRKLFVWEEESVGDLRIFLQNVSFQVHREDKWMWKVDSSSIYTVQSAYTSIIAQAHVENVVATPPIWHKDVPLKVVLFALRLFRDRLPTKDNLRRRRVIDFDAQICVGGCGLIETSAHLFSHCNFSSLVWNHIVQWLGVVMAVPNDVTVHFNQFNLLGGVTKSRQSIIQVIWFATV